MLKNARDKIQQRNKIIQIADTDAGWETVRLHEASLVANDSEDEAQIRKAESRALKRKTRKTSKKNARRAQSTIPTISDVQLFLWDRPGSGSTFFEPTGGQEAIFEEQTTTPFQPVGLQKHASKMKQIYFIQHCAKIVFACF